MRRGMTVVRSADADLFDAFLVAAIATVLLIRIALEATGYPRLGGGGLHIAHVLWGGLGMLVAMGLLLLFISSSTRFVAALVGGAGFGAFIDELGKFLTADNDYFFKPTAALVYALFVTLFLTVREIRLFRALTPAEKLANAVEISQKLVTGTLSEADRARALALLADADQTEPLVPALRGRFAEAQTVSSKSSPLTRIGPAAERVYARIAATRWFHRIVAGIFILQGLGFLLSVLAAAAVLLATVFNVPGVDVTLDDATGGTTVTSWIEVLSALIAGVLIARGVLALRRSRLRAYRAFELAILVDLLLSQPFAFLDLGFAAADNVLLDLALLAILRYLQQQEKGHVAKAGMIAASMPLHRA